MIRKLLAGAALALAFAMPAVAAPIIGAQLFATGGNVTITVEPATAGFTSELWLYEPGADVFIALNHDVGTVVNLGPFVAGTELIFGIFVRNTGDTFYMGPGSRNPDGLAHAAVDALSPTEAIVGFEDILGGGDLDYDDNVFRFVGVRPTQNEVPEPGSLLLIGGALAAFALRKKIA